MPTKTSPQRHGSLPSDPAEAKKSLELPTGFIYVPIKVLDPPEPIHKRKRRKK